MKKIIVLMCVFFGFSFVCWASDTTSDTAPDVTSDTTSDITIEEWHLCYQIDDRECSFPVTDGLVVNDEFKKVYFWVRVKSPRDCFIRHIYSFYGDETKPVLSYWSDEDRELNTTEKVPSIIEKVGLNEYVNAVVKLNICKSNGFRTWSTKSIGQALHCGKWTVDVVDDKGVKLIPTVEFAVASKR